MMGREKDKVLNQFLVSLCILLVSLRALPPITNRRYKPQNWRRATTYDAMYN